ncbi:MAG: ABC transporter permease [Clostridiales bacterium]|nr:ABC transporter permease [Clostridiales bacterium]
MRNRKSRISFIYGILAILVIWKLLSLILKLPIVPSPEAVFINIRHVFISKILIHAACSMARVFAGIMLSAVFGVPLGLMMGYYKWWDRLLSPIIYFIYPIPKIALLPVVMLLFGLGEASKIIMIMLIVSSQVIVSSRDAVMKIPSETYYSLYSLGAKPRQVFKKIIIPAVLPELVTSIRVALGTSVSILFFTETFGTEYGMGYFIMDSWMRVNYVEMYSGIVILSIMGFGLFTLVDFIERHLCPWK